MSVLEEGLYWVRVLNTGLVTIAEWRRLDQRWFIDGQPRPQLGKEVEVFNLRRQSLGSPSDQASN